MPFRPIQHPVVRKTAFVKQILEHSPQPHVVRLLLVLQTFHVFEIFRKFICIKTKLPGSPSQSREAGTDVFLSFIWRSASYYSVLISSQGNLFLKKYTSMYPTLSKSSFLPVPT